MASIACSIVGLSMMLYAIYCCGGMTVWWFLGWKYLLR